MSASPRVREREIDHDETAAPSAKRQKVENDASSSSAPTEEAGENPVEASSAPLEATDAAPSAISEELESLLPPSHSLLGTKFSSQPSADGQVRILETDVGISEYIAKDVPKIDGIIKQRFTDFLVYEVDLDHNVIHIKSLDMPESPSKKDKDEAAPATEPSASGEAMQGIESTSTLADAKIVEETPPVAPAEPASETPQPSDAPEPVTPKTLADPWPETFTTRLATFLSEEKVALLKQMFLEGPEPPFVSDAGWGGRSTMNEASPSVAETAEEKAQDEPEEVVEKEVKGRGKRGRERGGRGARGGRGGRGGRPGRPGAREDHRKVLSDPIVAKSTRTELHQAVRELFGGKLDSETDTTAPADDEGSRIVIKWSRRGGGRGGGRGSGRGDKGSKSDRPSRGNFPPYIHFTLQKTNRDTQDALAYLARTLHVNVKDLSTAGTKDKRGVTVQRVALRRGGKAVEDIWRLANGVPGRHSVEEAVRERGERGVRIADLNYRKAGLELGMLKGNAFVITLRNVQVDSTETLNRAMNSIKDRGFINYYGMQRFGTASIPTHSIGLALLKEDWHRAVSLILRTRPGEHPDVVAARQAWLVDGDLDRALELMPRRVVAERCILESYRKQNGETRNALGALSTIPRNLRLMYVHAYQSYVWNAIVSERIRTYGAEKAAVGDLVLVSTKAVDGDMEVDEVEVESAADNGPSRGSRREKKPWQPAQVKTLTAEDVDKHSIFDVVMPLPGKDVAFPGGSLGERYKEFLRKDGLDPDNFNRRQKDYSLSGSYRNIMHLPRELSWDVLRYTDPDVPLAQSDEDKLLGYDAPAIVPDGRFLALQIRLTLGTAAYATMALREVTKTETSSHFQSSLTQASQDQQFKSGGEAAAAGVDASADADAEVVEEAGGD